MILVVDDYQDAARYAIPAVLRFASLKLAMATKLSRRRFPCART
jgi:hypothetical protein